MAQAMNISRFNSPLQHPTRGIFTSTFTHMADEPNQSTRYTLVEAFGNGEDSVFDATGGGIPTEPFEKSPKIGWSQMNKETESGLRMRCVTL